MADQFELKAIKINGDSVTSSAEALNNQQMNITQSKFAAIELKWTESCKSKGIERL